MSQDNSIEFNRLMARNKHLEKMVSRYKQPEEWENLTEGDAVIIDNSDSLHDGQRGKFLAHDWAIAGYVRLVVVFPDGQHCYYLPTQVVRAYPEPIEPEQQPAPVATPQPEPERKGIDFSKIKIADQAELEEATRQLIESKLAQVAKMPPSTRKKILISGLSNSLSPELVKRAVSIAIERGIIPA